MDKIVDGLYLGDIQGASNLFLLKRIGITHILQVAAGFQPFFPGVKNNFLTLKQQFKYKVVNVLDMPFENIMKYFQSCIAFIRQAISSGGKVLVHWQIIDLNNIGFSFAGVSRSASVVISYLMSEMNMQMYQAMSFVRQRRPIIFPNPGFQKQLLDFERQLKIFKSSPQPKTSSKLIEDLTPQKHSEKSHGQLGNSAQAVRQKLEVKYVSQSADKNKGGVQGKTRDHYQRMDDAWQIYGKQTNLVQGKGSERAQTSHGGLRGSTTKDNSMKNEHVHKLNKNLLNSHQSPSEINIKQNRAKSSYGQKHSHNRNIQDQLIPTLSQQFTKSIEPSLAYMNERQMSQVKMTHQPNTVGQSLYNSLQKQSKDNLGDNNHNQNKNLILDEFHANVQYSCGLCAMPLFASKDILDHNLGVISSSQRGNSSQHSHKLSQNSHNLFGKTFSGMSNNAQSFSTSHRCTSLFIKRKEWINEQDGSQGNILCPRKNCAVRIGVYCWQGQRCSTCGQFVSPAFQIFRNRITQNQEKAYEGAQNEKQSFKNLDRVVEDIARKTGSFNKVQNLLIQSPDTTKKSVNTNLNLSYSEPSKKQKPQIKKQHSAMDDFLKIVHKQQIEKSNGMANIKTQSKEQKPFTSQERGKSTQQHSKQSSNVYSGLSKANMNNLYQQLIAEQNKRLLGQQAINNQFTPGKRITKK